jgi:hypothetical protein
MPSQSDDTPEETEDHSPNRENAAEAGTFVAETLVQLMAICERHQFDTLGYLLAMAHLEASEISRRFRRVHH